MTRSRFKPSIVAMVASLIGGAVVMATVYFGLCALGKEAYFAEVIACWAFLNTYVNYGHISKGIG